MEREIGSTAFRDSGLVGHWIHAHERDSADARVYVGPEVKLGPSRGRTRYEFDESGRFVEQGPGPTDRVTARRGRASIDGDVLVLAYKDGTERRLRFVCDKGCLRLLRSG